MNTIAGLTLWYDDILVGHLTNAFYSDRTWWGTLSRVAQPSDGQLACRLLSFIDFCEDWNERTRRNPAAPPDAAEFDQYDDVLKSGL